MNKITIMLQLANYESWGVKSILIGAIIALSGVVAYLYKSKESALKEKDAKIMEVVKDHQDDLKAENQTMRDLVDKYHQFTQSIKEMVNNGRV